MQGIMYFFLTMTIRIFCLIEPFSNTSYSHNLVRLNEQLLIHSIIEPNGQCNTRTFLLPK